MHSQRSGRSRGLLATSALASASLVLSSGAAFAAPDSPPGDPVRVIVELDTPTAADVVGQEELAAARSTGSVSASARSAFAADYRAAVEEVTGAQETVTARIEREGVELEDAEAVTGLLSAVVATVDPADLDELRSAPGVARVTEAAD